MTTPGSEEGSNMTRIFTMSKPCRTILAIALASLAATSVQASIFGEFFAQKQAGETAEAPDNGHDDRNGPPTANDEFAQRAKEVVSSVATDVLPESGSPPSTVNHDINGVIGDPTHTHDHRESPNRSGGNAEDFVGNEADPGLGDHVESSDRTADLEEPSAAVPETVTPQEKVPEPVDMSKAIAGSDTVPMADREASNLVNHELEEVNSPLGPKKPLEITASAPSTTRNDVPYSAEMHSALKSRVEAALASLSGVYDALLHSGIPNAKTPDVDPIDRTNAIEKRPPVAVPVLQEVPASSPEVAMKDEKVTSEYGDTPTERAAAQAAHEREEAGSQAKGGFATAVLSVFAGLVFVAAVGLMIAGFAFSNRMHESSTHQPLYPPSGPSFV